MEYNSKLIEHLRQQNLIEYKNLKFWIETIQNVYSKFGKQLGDPDPTFYDKLK